MAATHPAFGEGTVESTAKTSFIRAPGEAAVRVPLRDFLVFRIKGSLGVARGEVRTHTTTTGVFVLGDPSRSSEFWIGFTWEVSPYAVVEFEPVLLEVGVRHAGFPTKNASDRFSEFEW